MNDDKLLGCFGVVFLIAFVVIVGSLLNGWSLSVLWGWFVAPTFGLPGLTIAQGLGISLIISFFTQDLKQEKAGEGKDKTEAIIYAILSVVIKPLVFLGIGLIYLQFM